MKKTIISVSIILVGLMCMASVLIAADATSYAPPGVTQNLAMDRHGQSISNASTVQATGDMRAPRYYDSQNTGYYLDPASTSVTNRVLSYYNGGMPTSTYDVATKKYVDSKAGGPVCSFGTSGYCKWSSGLIVQWGAQVYLSPQQTRKITFPIAFPHACLHADINDTNRSDSLLNVSMPSRPTRTAITLTNSGGGSGKYAWWSAWGY